MGTKARLRLLFQSNVWYILQFSIWLFWSQRTIFCLSILFLSAKSEQVNINLFNNWLSVIKTYMKQVLGVTFKVLHRDTVTYIVPGNIPPHGCAKDALELTCHTSNNFHMLLHPCWQDQDQSPSVWGVCTICWSTRTSFPR